MKSSKFFDIIAGTACAVLAAAPAIGNAGEIRVRTELDRDVLVAGRAQKAIVRICIEPGPVRRPAKRPATNVGIVLDRSGSMQGKKLRYAKEGAVEALDRLDRRDTFSLVAYAREVNTVVSARQVDNTTSIARSIREIEAGGNTALHAGVKQGAAELSEFQDTGRFNRLILLSDGLANVGPSTPGALKRLGQELSGEDISVSTVGVGLGFNEDLMTALAEAGGGNTYFVESVEDLPRIFEAEIGDVLNVAARKVVIQVECGEGVRPVRVIGRKANVRGGRVEVEIPQVYGGQEKDVLLEVEVTGGHAGKARDLASVDVRYEDAGTGGAVTIRSKASAKFTGDARKSEASANVTVIRLATDNEIAEAKDEAVRLMDEGKKSEAASCLRDLKVRVSTKNANLDDGYLEKQTDALEAEAADLESKGMSNAKRKSYRAESWQTRNQQKKH